MGWEERKAEKMKSRCDAVQHALSTAYGFASAEQAKQVIAVLEGRGYIVLPVGRIDQISIPAGNPVLDEIPDACIGED